jgi:hypothetical protein
MRIFAFMTTATPPTRDVVASRWRAVASGHTTREDVGAWTEPLLFAEFESSADVMVLQALQYLHGFDMTYRSPDNRFTGHGPPGPYVRTLSRSRRSTSRGKSAARPTTQTPRVGSLNGAAGKSSGLSAPEV